MNLEILKKYPIEERTNLLIDMVDAQPTAKEKIVLFKLFFNDFNEFYKNILNINDVLFIKYI